MALYFRVLSRHFSWPRNGAEISQGCILGHSIGKGIDLALGGGAERFGVQLGIWPGIQLIRQKLQPKIVRIATAATRRHFTILLNPINYLELAV